jgi:serine phosphatase RsbU (regulator of sigma subunit)/rhodanese-related sulfurtransferase
MESKPFITVANFNQLVKSENVSVIDVRSAEEFKEKHIPFATNIPVKDIETGEAHIDTGKTIITVCGSGGGRSTRAANFIRENYATEAFFLENGTFGWLENERKSREEKLTFIQRFIRGGHQPGDTEDQKLKKTSLIIMTLPFGLVGLIWGLMYFASGLILPGMIPFSYGILSFISIGLFVAFKNFKFFRFSQIFLILLLPFFLQISLGGFIPSSSIILWSIISPLASLFFFNTKQSVYWFCAYVLVVVIAFVVNDYLPRYFNWHLSEGFINRFFIMNIIGIGLIIFLLQYYFVVQQVALKRSDEQKSKELHEKSKEITDSINYAKRIQTTMLANEGILNNNLPDYFILFKPKDIVSGDFYWATNKNDKFYLAACDSTGHGVPGAFMSLLNISFLNEAINERNISLPNEICGHVRNRLIESISADGGKDGMDGVLVCVDNEKKKLSFAAAHNAPILIRNGSVIEFEADKMPIGKGIRLDDFKHQSIDVEPGDLFYLYTDGYTDQFGGPKGKKFKYKQMKALLQSVCNQSMAEQKNILEAIIDNWRGNLEQTDDMLIIGFKVR